MNPFQSVTDVLCLSSLSPRVEDAQSVNTVKNGDEGLFVKRLRSLFPAIEIKVDHVCALPALFFRLI